MEGLLKPQTFILLWNISLISEYDVCEDCFTSLSAQKGNIATEKSPEPGLCRTLIRSPDYALLLFRMTLIVLYSAQYHIQHCTLHAFEQSGARWQISGPIGITTWYHVAIPSRYEWAIGASHQNMIWRLKGYIVQEGLKTPANNRTFLSRPAWSKIHSRLSKCHRRGP